MPRSDLRELDQFETLLPSWFSIVNAFEDFTKLCDNWAMVLLKVYQMQRQYIK